MDFLSPGDILKNRWRIIKQIGVGGFGEIYEGVNIVSGLKVAVKAEDIKSKKPLLSMEVQVLKALQDCPKVCRFFGCGRTDRINYISMELLGRNLSELRKEQPNQLFSLSTSLLIIRQALDAVTALHDAGFLHRDVKPSNFAIGCSPQTCRNVYIYDFGLCRNYCDERGRLRKPRSVTGFRGTLRYASINAHRNIDLGRHDDILSLFYMLVEFITGELPWKSVKEKSKVFNLKVQTTTQELLLGKFEELQKIYLYCKELSFFETPSYHRIRRYISRTMEDHQVSLNDAFDWQVNGNHNLHYSELRDNRRQLTTRASSRQTTRSKTSFMSDFIS